MALELPRLNKACCCVPLRIGSMIIGYVSIIVSCIVIAMISLAIYRVTVFLDKNMNKPFPQHPPEDMARAALGLYISFTYYIIVYLYNLVFSVILLIGVHKNEPLYLRLYYKATLFSFALGAALVVITCMFMGILATIPVLKWVFALFYFLVVVRSTFLEMEATEKQPIHYELQPHVMIHSPLIA
ncbi:unnamed protein product [Arctia plantaginis]|uniref:Uncharacterized protein n=1 Tax=Arctia plantaginis TaxID=874455 RepID=A0A8S0Z591_ARCPL|nr:unnamed protein product [Arctia plantaginis]CAB3228284.1 unnamed protein product [Arctia plantaginis]